MESPLTFDFEDGGPYGSFTADDRDGVMLRVEARYARHNREGLRLGENVRLEWANDDVNRIDVVIMTNDRSEKSVVGRIRAS